jgi:hypothetical protein
MFRNPEFIRNTWTELTLKKVAAMPLFLVTIYAVVNMMSDIIPIYILPSIYMFFYLVFTYIWGTRLAAETVVKEINNNTWSSQVMTSMSPLKMAIGKLFGSTVYIWYGNIICFIMLIMYFHFYSDIRMSDVYTDIAIFSLLGLCAHILPLLVSLHSIRWRHFFERFDLTFFQFVGITAATPLYFVFANGMADKTVNWYGVAYNYKEIIIIFALIFIIWGFTAIVNQIKTEFGQEPYPVSWFLFTTTLVAVLFGFNDCNTDNLLAGYAGTLYSFFAILTITYLTVCGESNMALRPHMVYKYYKTGQYKRIFMIMPRSLVTIPIIVALAFILGYQFGTRDAVSGMSVSYIVWAMIMFMLRDFCFIYLWSLFAQGNEKETTVVPVLVTLASYTILPVLLFNFDLKVFCPFFMPYFHRSIHFSYNESAFLAVIPPTIEFIIIFVLLELSIRKKFKELSI